MMRPAPVVFLLSFREPARHWRDEFEVKAAPQNREKIQKRCEKADEDFAALLTDDQGRTWEKVSAPHSRGRSTGSETSDPLLDFVDMSHLNTQATQATFLPSSAG